MRQALEHGAEAILLDNMTPENVREAVEICSRLTRRPPLECSGESIWRTYELMPKRAWILFPSGIDSFFGGGGYEHESSAGVRCVGGRGEAVVSSGAEAFLFFLLNVGLKVGSSTKTSGRGGLS